MSRSIRLFRKYCRLSAGIMVRPDHPGVFALMSRWRRYFRQYGDLTREAAKTSEFRVTPSFPCLAEDTGQSGYASFYIYQDTWAFQHLARLRPRRLVDISSSTYFVAFAARVVEQVVAVDFRPLHLHFRNLAACRADVTHLPFRHGSLEFVSSLCVIEHVGLGRYNDPIDYGGMEKAAAEIERLIAPGGHLLVSFPVGAENVIHFNAQRVVTREKALEMFPAMDLIDEQYACSHALISRDEFSEEILPYVYGCYLLRKR